VTLVRGFEPIVGEDAGVIILGTLPGGDSLRLGQYYADSGNAFWYIVQQLFGINKDAKYDERVRGLIKNRIAIWDVLEQAERRSSLDNKIVRGTEVANDFARFFRRCSCIQAVFFNGGRAERYFHTLVVPSLQIKGESPRLHPALQSTSATNSHYSQEEKVELWRVAQQALAL